MFHKAEFDNTNNLIFKNLYGRYHKLKFSDKIYFKISGQDINILLDYNQNFKNTFQLN